MSRSNQPDLSNNKNSRNISNLFILMNPVSLLGCKLRIYLMKELNFSRAEMKKKCYGYNWA